MKPPFIPKIQHKTKCVVCKVALKEGDICVLQGNQNFHRECFEKVIGHKIPDPKFLKDKLKNKKQ